MAIDGDQDTGGLTEVDGLQDEHANEHSELTSASESHEVRESITDPHRLAKSFLRQLLIYKDASFQTVRFWRNQFWGWRSGHYRVIDKQELRAEVVRAVKRVFDDHAEQVARLRTSDDSEDEKSVLKVTRSLSSNVVQALESIRLVPGDVDQPAWLGTSDEAADYLAMENGLVDLGSLLLGHGASLRKHTPDWFSPVFLPYPFREEAQCPGWVSFLREVLGDDSQRIALVQEWFGYCLAPDTSLQKFLIAYGEGANGKNVLLATLTGLVGEKNVSHVPVELFGDRFQLTPTLGKRVNIASEMGEIDRISEGVLKGFTSGDRMYFDRKGIAGVEANPTARLVFATNTLPRFADRSSGVWRRMLLLPFEVVVPEERQDPKLPARLREELPGVFNWAISGLQRLKAQGQFTVSDLSRLRLEEYRLESNPAKLFLTEACIADPTSEIPSKHLYAAYRAWCKASGHLPLNDRTFGKEVKRVFPNVSRSRPGSRGKREHVYRGIAVTDASNVSQEFLRENDLAPGMSVSDEGGHRKLRHT